ncbi:MAG TPA: hypothetical protein PKB09_01840 [Candidatus Saccharibacteria bacterium]|nr:hypothetical protein [Candidatus Saccharibacteria bacterium]
MISESIPFTFSFQPNDDTRFPRPDRAADTIVFPEGDQLVNPYGDHSMNVVFRSIVEFPSRGSHSGDALVAVSYDFNAIGSVVSGFFINRDGLESASESYTNTLNTFIHPDLTPVLELRESGTVSVDLPISQFLRWQDLFDIEQVYKKKRTAIISQEEYDI